MACDPTSLTQFVICGSSADLCGEDIPVLVQVTMVNPQGGPVVDPTNKALVAGFRWSGSFNDGCFCTCPILVNSAAAADEALQPSDTSYRIQVSGGGEALVDTIVHINLEDFNARETTTADCDGVATTCINIVDLLILPPGDPVPDSFCQAVTDCGFGTSSFSDNGDGTYTHENGIGSSTTFAVGNTSVVSEADNGDGTRTYTHDDGNGNTTQWTTCACTILVDNGDGSFTVTNPDGSTVTIPAPVVTTLVDNGDGSFTYTNEAGIQVTIPAATIVDNGDGSYTVTGTDGNSETITTGAAGGSTSTFTDNGDGTITHSDGAATPVMTTVDICALINANCPATAVDNGDGTYTITGTDGNSVTIPAETVTTLTTNADGSLTYTSEDGTQTNVPAQVVTTLVLNADGSHTYTSEDGTQTTIPAPAGGTATTSSFADNGDGSFTHNDGASPNVATTISICDLLDDLAVNATSPPAGVTVLGSDCEFHALPSGAVSAQSTLTDNGDGSFTHSDGAATPTTTTISICDLIDDINPGVSAPGDQVVAIDAAGACKVITAPASSFTDNGNGSVTHVSGDGSITTVSICDLLDDIPTNATGVPVGTLLLGNDCEFHPLISADPCQALEHRDDGLHVNQHESRCEVFRFPDYTFNGTTDDQPGDPLVTHMVNVTNPSDCLQADLMIELGFNLHIDAGPALPAPLVGNNNAAVNSVEAQFFFIDGVQQPVVGAGYDAYIGEVTVDFRHVGTYSPGSLRYSVTLAPGQTVALEWRLAKGVDAFPNYFFSQVENMQIATYLTTRST